MSEELKPCPFCGGEAELVSNDIGVFVGCFHENCPIGPQTSTYLDGYATEAEAIAAWNARTERTCRQEESGWSTEGDHARVWLTCGHDCMVPTVQDLPTYCPNCGAKVIEEKGKRQ